MTYADEIIERSKSYLTSGWFTGKLPTRTTTKISPELVFDHSLRVLDTARLLLKDPDVRVFPIDPTILTACAMFHDAGWVDLVRTGQIQYVEIFTRPADLETVKRSAQIAVEQIGKLLPAGSLKKVSQIIQDLKQPRPSLPESRVLADADNLDEFGLLGITLHIRAAHSQGKSVRQVIDIWHRQQEYNYWEARVKSAFHLESSRKIARRRLENMAKVFHLLHQESTLEDLDLRTIFPDTTATDFPSPVRA